jgi:pyruvate dehydrogenase E1 component alpha subunit
VKNKPAETPGTLARGQEAPKVPPLEEPETLLWDLLRKMIQIRVFEDYSMQAFRAGLAGGYLHLYSGMEATAVGWLSCIREGDPVITAYRDHGHALALGIDPYEVMAEIMGRATGVSKGKGGSMHLYSREKNFYGGWGIVGGHTALGVGLAFASKYWNRDEVTHLFYGDGAVNAGIVYEVMNMASLWDLPVVFIIENNLVAMGTRVEYHSADPVLHHRAEGFRIEHERIDGMDVLEVRKNAKRIIERVRSTQRPYLVEVVNYRFEGHGAADHDRTLYRTKEEEEEWKKRDPIRLLMNAMLARGIGSEEEFERIWRETDEEMRRVYDRCAEAPKPAPEQVYEDVYTDMRPEEGH